ncbi:Chaperone protein DnaJ [Apiospora aurea]|uniref:Chaperone protein DnaJ n=1 Tax=Apiospora aurea TaxID=335848 RepID=A0ABR1QE47_9PEZI
MPLRYIAALPTPALCPAPLIVFGARPTPTPTPNRLLTPSSSSSRARPKPRQQVQRPFHSTACLRDEEIDRATNHYEALKLPTNATPADIKRSFYSLSKSNHPDHNHSDPAASKRFMRISEAYTTLSSPEKRTRYDRDVLNLHHPARRAGSYSSTATTTNPAGGRPASGLSKRRSAFRGPPPSFYRSGGWGAHSAKRSAAHESSTGSRSRSRSRRRRQGDHHNDGAWATGGGPGATAGGMGPGQDPFKGSQDDVPHFDREGHERTGRRTEEARTSRRRMRTDGLDAIEAERGAMGMFFIIGGILLTSFLVPLGIYRVFWGPKTKDQKRKAKT